MESVTNGLKISGIHMPGSLRNVDSLSGSMLYRKLQLNSNLNFGNIKFYKIIFCETSVKKMFKWDAN